MLNIKIILIFAIVLSSCSAGKSVGLKTAAEKKPNIILINIDDLGWKDVSFMGSHLYETPNIDSLASMGTVFTNGYAAAAVCTPSRASLITGKWTPRHGIYTVGSSERGRKSDRKLIPVKNTGRLAVKHPTIPKILSKHGYITCHSGKWHLSETPRNYGFDLNIAGSFVGEPESYYPPYKNIVIEDGESTYLTDLIMEKTLEFVDSVQQPFFLNYWPYAVHKPINPAYDLMDKYLEKVNAKEHEDGQNNAAYATMVENVDRNIGLLISKLEDKAMLDNTILIFTSDNGAVARTSLQRPLRAGKGSYYEGGIRVPFFCVWKDKVRENAQVEAAVSHLDIFPTVLEAAGINDKDYELDGLSLLPVLKGKKPKSERSLFWHFPIYLHEVHIINNDNRDPLFLTRPGSVMRKGDWKLHYYFENDEVELYNLADDIGERNDLSGTEPDRRDKMLKQLEKWWKETGAPTDFEMNPRFLE